MHHEMRRIRHPQATRRQRGRAVTQRVTDPRSLAKRASREPAILIRRHAITASSLRPLPLCASGRALSMPLRLRHHIPGSRLAPRCGANRGVPNPRNTAGPVLPHRPSKTPPVLRNHREGLVTCSTVATCTEKTTPVGLLVTQRKHQRFRCLPSGFSSRAGCPWDEPVSRAGPGLAAGFADWARHTCGTCTAWFAGLPRRAGAWLHAATDEEAQWWHWQVSERCGGRTGPPVSGTNGSRPTSLPPRGRCAVTRRRRPPRGWICPLRPRSHRRRALAEFDGADRGAGRRR